MFEYYKFTKYWGCQNYQISAPGGVKWLIFCQKN